MLIRRVSDAKHDSFIPLLFCYLYRCDTNVTVVTFVELIEDNCVFLFSDPVRILNFIFDKSVLGLEKENARFDVDFNMQRIEKRNRENEKLLSSYFTVQSREKLSNVWDEELRKCQCQN